MKGHLQSPASSFWSPRLIEIFGIDPRSLASFRIATAMVLLYDLAGRVVDVRAFYSDTGIVSIAQQQEVCLPWLWSLNFSNGSIGFQTAIFAVAFIFALALLVGFATRLSTVGCWILVVSIHVRGSDLLVNGGDILLVQMLFWGMFLPLGQYWSLDSVLGKSKPTTLEPMVSFASAAILLQIFLMYFFTGLMKMNEIWYSGLAMENALSYDIFVKPAGSYLLNFPGLLKFVTYTTLCLELIGPFLFFIPWKTAYFRLILWGIFMLMHIGIEITMTVALFSYICMAALTLFLPTGFWDWLLKRKVESSGENSLLTPVDDHKSRRLERKRRWQDEKEKAQRNFITRLRTDYGVISRYICEGFVVFMLLFVFLWNIGSVIPIASDKVRQGMLRFANVTYVNQVWYMFDYPNGNDPWYVAEAHLKDGSKVDILKAGAPIDKNKPEQLYASFQNHRWKMLYTRLSPQGMAVGYGAVYRDGLVDYLRREWDARHNPEKQIITLNLHHYTETRLPGIEEYPVTLASAGDLGYGNYYRNGMRQGSWELQDAKGNKAKGKYVDGKKEGFWTEWYPNGQKKNEGPFINSLIHGHFNHWTADGRKEGEGSYRFGKYDGKWKFWNANGELLEFAYKDGVLLE